MRWLLLVLVVAGCGEATPAERCEEIGLTKTNLGTEPVCAQACACDAPETSSPNCTSEACAAWDKDSCRDMGAGNGRFCLFSDEPIPAP